MSRTVDYRPGVLTLLDQTRIPEVEQYLEYRDINNIADAIVNMVVRGAPAIGAAAVCGIAIAGHSQEYSSIRDLLDNLDKAADILRTTRPTAVNLFWGIERMVSEARKVALQTNDPIVVINALDTLATAILDEDEQTNRAIGRFGASVIPDKCGILTHCNAGALACVDYGTALGVIRAAIESGKHVDVYADETRPRLQGMRLTCYELVRDGINTTVITDNMAGSLMRKGLINVVVVGADRIACNGDTANKIGTYSVAVLAKYHNIPFYVAAPWSTIDTSLSNGDDIPIEERSHDEVTHIDGHQIAPEDVNVINPAFDVTPSNLISGIITEKGIYTAPYNFLL